MSFTNVPKFVFSDLQELSQSSYTGYVRSLRSVLKNLSKVYSVGSEMVRAMEKYNTYCYQRGGSPEVQLQSRTGFYIPLYSKGYFSEQQIHASGPLKNTCPIRFELKYYVQDQDRDVYEQALQLLSEMDSRLEKLENGEVLDFTTIAFGFCNYNLMIISCNLQGEETNSIEFVWNGDCIVNEFVPSFGADDDFNRALLNDARTNAITAMHYILGTSLPVCTKKAFIEYRTMLGTTADKYTEYVEKQILPQMRKITEAFELFSTEWMVHTTDLKPMMKMLESDLFTVDINTSLFSS